MKPNFKRARKLHIMYASVTLMTFSSSLNVQDKEIIIAMRSYQKIIFHNNVVVDAASQSGTISYKNMVTIKTNFFADALRATFKIRKK